MQAYELDNMAENVAQILVGALMVQYWVCHMVGKRGSFGAHSRLYSRVNIAV